MNNYQKNETKRARISICPGPGFNHPTNAPHQSIPIKKVEKTIEVSFLKEISCLTFPQIL